MKLSKRAVRGAVHAALELLGMDGDELAVHFVSKRAIEKLHEEFFNDPSITDCITFPMDADEDLPYRHLGDLFICPHQALLYSKKKRGCPYKETLLYIVHGLLHLKGYDDQLPADRKRMKAKEKEMMRLLSRKKITIKIE